MELNLDIIDPILFNYIAVSVSIPQKDISDLFNFRINPTFRTNRQSPMSYSFDKVNLRRLWVKIFLTTA